MGSDSADSEPRQPHQEPLSPLPLSASPMRVLVLGASTVSWTSWMGGPRSDFTFPRVIEASLLASGRAAEVRNAAVLGSPTAAFFDRWEEQVLQWSPDVVVVLAGHYETVHLMFPHWFERHANRVDFRPGPLRTPYRRRMLRPLWKALATVQCKLDGILPAGLLSRRLSGVARTVSAYVTVSRQVASPAFVLMELLPPSQNRRHWFPGMTARIAVVNEAIAVVAADFNSADVAFFHTSEVAARLYGDNLEAATPDGFHFTPELHRAIGEELARWILNWVGTQPHLLQPTSEGE